MERTFGYPEVLAAWDWGGALAGALPYGAGHINATFCVYVQRQSGEPVRYILQKINTDTFTDPDALMQNICGVTGFLRRKAAQTGGDAARATMQVVPTRMGGAYFRAADGGCWRVYRFVEDTVCLQKAGSEQDFYESAVAFGNFQRLLDGYPAATLHETIAHFHDTPARYRNFEKALAADALGRAASAAAEIAFVQARRADCAALAAQLAAGKLPLRVTHNDTKLNNVLLDQTTSKGVCVIDLDTVMPGLAAYDYGDSIRFGANDCAEDEPDQTRVHFSLPLFKTYTRGFLQAAGDTFSAAERESLPWGARLMTLECGIRFLTDYLEGDHYFHTARPGQNLDRARTQFTLVRQMEQEWARMTAFVAGTEL